MRVLFSCTASDGHFLPLVPLARAFAAAGHSVAFATAASYAHRVQVAGFDTLPAGLEAREHRAAMKPYLARLRALPPDDRRPQQFTWRFATLDAPTKVDALLAEATTWQPELVVHETADLAAPAVAEALGVPSAQHGFGRLVPRDCLDRAAPVTAKLWRELGLEPDPLSGLYRGAYVDIWPPSLRDAPPPAGTFVLHLRPVTTTAGDAAWCTRLDGGDPTVYVTLGTVFNDLARFRMLLAAVAELDCTVLATIGRNNDPAELEPLPRNVLVEQYVPQADVLPFCDAAVSHGGAGSTLAAFAHGLPMLLLPQSADQFDNAASAAASGAATVLRPDAVTATAVTAAVRSLLDESPYSAAAKSVALDIASMPSPEVVVAALTDFASATRPPS